VADRRSDGTFAPGNQLARKHGAEKALKALQKGEAFDKHAQEVYELVISELAVPMRGLTGIDQVRVKRAARFEAVARMFDVAAMAAASQGKVEDWERFQQRSGWIGSKAFTALTEIGKAVASSAVLDYEDVLAAAREAKREQG